jgi:nucleoid-associated protein YgaU
MTTKKTLTALAILTTLTACDYAARKDLADERESRHYRAAMADYKAGRIEAAIAGFEKTIREEPANAGARFQYACLLQDSGKDSVGAYCAYREYISQHPESDKAAVAAKRMAICEKEVAQKLAEKHKIAADSAVLARELESTRKDAAELRSRLSEKEREIEEFHKRIDSLVAERGRLVAIVKGIGDNVDQTPSAPSQKELRELLEEDEDDDGARARISADVARIRAEEKNETETGSSLLPARTAEDVAKRDAAIAAEQKRREDAAAAMPKHPPTYVVQEGDTLYRIAVRFYGRLSAWKRIRDANKAIISNDGRVRAGDTITLPD